MTELGATVSWHDELMATCRAEPLTTDNISRRLAAVHKVLGSTALQTQTNSHFEEHPANGARSGADLSSHERTYNAGAQCCNIY